MKALLITSVLFYISGCAGLDIKSITKSKADEAHSIDKSVEGYIVYHPMVLVEVINKDVCTGRKADGTCNSIVNVCGYGQIIYIPDYSKPYLVDSTSGFGKAGIDIQITNGWMLAGLKDTSDNTAILSKILPDVAPLAKSTGECSELGLYKIDQKNMTLEKWKTW